MKSISKFLSGYLFILSTAPAFTSGMECSYSYCTCKDRHSTELTVQLPCGCNNHAYCLVNAASSGGCVRKDDQYKCLNKQCPNPKQGRFETAENFWKYMWDKCPIDEGANWAEKNWKPICCHPTAWYVKENYWCWLKNRDNGKDDYNWWNPSNLANASKAYNTKRLCAVCRTGKKWID